MKLWRLLCAAVIGIALLPMAASPSARAEIDVYTTKGEHTVNGRRWLTDCVPFSQTQRCTTEIWSTKVTQVDGRFVQTNGWVFNNLTYVPSPRALWKGNPLGGNGVVAGRVSWTAQDGRKWRTECDTAVTGGNGCRSYVEARVIESYRSASGANAFRWSTKWVFNNLVRFTASAPAPTPTAPGGHALGKVVDPELRACVAEAAGVAANAVLSPKAAAGLTELDCTGAGVKTLAGMPALPNLELLFLGMNELTNLSGLPRAPKLVHLELFENRLTSVAGMPSLPALVQLDLVDNQITDLSALPALPELAQLYASENRLTDLSRLPAMPNLLELWLDGNQVRDLAFLSRFPQLDYVELGHNGLTSLASMPDLRTLSALGAMGNELTEVASIPALPSLSYLDLGDNQISVVAPLATRTKLAMLWLEGNPVTDLASLKPLVVAGCEIDLFMP